MGAFFDADFENARHHAPVPEHMAEERERRIEAYRQEIGKFLDLPYRFDLPAGHVRLTDQYPDNFYMCRNGNRTAAAGFIEELIEDSLVDLSPERKEGLSAQHRLIADMPLDRWEVDANGNRQKAVAWRTPEEMGRMKAALEETCRIIDSLLAPAKPKTPAAGTVQ